MKSAIWVWWILNFCCCYFWSFVVIVVWRLKEIKQIAGPTWSSPLFGNGGKLWFSETAAKMKRWRGIKVGSAYAHRMLDNRHKSQHDEGLTGLCPLRGVVRLLRGWRGGWVLRWGLLIGRWPDCSCRCRTPCSEWLRLRPAAAACRRRSGMPSSSFRQTFWTSPLWVRFHREYMNDGSHSLSH